MGFAIAPNPGNGNGATWTNSSMTPVEVTIGFSWSPSAFAPQQYEGFEGGTAGNAPAAADLATGSKGWNGCQWQVTADQLTYATAASLPLLNNTGLLGDGTSYAAGSGTLGIIGNATGGAIGQVTCGFNHSNITNAVLTYKQNDNAASSDAAEMDEAAINGTSGHYASSDNYGTGATRYYYLETDLGNGSTFNLSGGTAAASCGTSAGQGCSKSIYFNGSGGNSTATAYRRPLRDRRLRLPEPSPLRRGPREAAWPATPTTSSPPSGFAFAVSGCTGGTNYNGNLFFVTGVTGATITATTTALVNGGTTVTVSGSATGCTLTGQNALITYNFSGGLVSAGFHAADTSTGTTVQSWTIAGTVHSITNADVWKWDSFQFSFINNTQQTVITVPSMCYEKASPS